MEIITLIQDYVSGLLEAEEDFLEHPNTLDVLEQNVSELSRKMAADFIGLVLTGADRLIWKSGIRKKEFTVRKGTPTHPDLRHRRYQFYPYPV